MLVLFFGTLALVSAAPLVAQQEGLGDGLRSP